MPPSDDDQQQGAHEHAGLAGFGGSPECTLCPICVLMQALTSTRPEVSQHLVAAGRELTLAVLAVLEGQAEAADRASERLQQIKIE